MKENPDILEMLNHNKSKELILDYVKSTHKEIIDFYFKLGEKAKNNEFISSQFNAIFFTSLESCFAEILFNHLPEEACEIVMNNFCRNVLLHIKMMKND